MRIFEKQGFILLLFILSALFHPPCLCVSDPLRYSLWKLGGRADMSSMSRTTSVSSTTACCSLCMLRHNCNRVCYDVRDKNCYVKNVSSSQSPLNQTFTKTVCYSMLQECPITKGYSMVGGRCVKLYTASKSFFKARETCAEDRAHLIDIKSEHEDVDILMSLRTDTVTTEKFWSWVGANDLTKEGSFVWSDGTPLSTNSGLWKGNEPSGVASDTAASDEDCVSITKLGLLNDRRCALPHVFVCQVDVE